MKVREPLLAQSLRQPRNVDPGFDSSACCSPKSSWSTTGPGDTAPLFGGLLVNVSPRDPFTIVVTSLALLGTAVLASAAPALHAARVDPMASLKAE